MIKLNNKKDILKEIDSDKNGVYGVPGRGRKLCETECWQTGKIIKREDCKDCEIIKCSYKYKFAILCKERR